MCVRLSDMWKSFRVFVTQFNSGKILFLCSPRALLNFGHEHEKASFPSNWSKNGWRLIGSVFCCCYFFHLYFDRPRGEVRCLDRPYSDSKWQPTLIWIWIWIYYTKLAKMCSKNKKSTRKRKEKLQFPN